MTPAAGAPHAAGRTAQNEKPATKPAGAARVNPPATRPSRRSASSTRPTSNPTQGPVEIFWNGPLTVVPLPGDRPERIASGQSIIRLAGTPARPVDVTHSSEQGSSRIKCAHLTFWTIDNGALLESAPSIPVEMTDSRGTYITTRSMMLLLTSVLPIADCVRQRGRWASR